MGASSTPYLAVEAAEGLGERFDQSRRDRPGVRCDLERRGACRRAPDIVTAEYGFIESREGQIIEQRGLGQQADRLGETLGHGERSADDGRRETTTGPDQPDA